MKLFEDKERKIMLELICEKQIEILIEDRENFISEKYIELEELKARINDM